MQWRKATLYKGGSTNNQQRSEGNMTKYYIVLNSGNYYIVHAHCIHEARNVAYTLWGVWRVRSVGVSKPKGVYVTTIY